MDGRRLPVGDPAPWARMENHYWQRLERGGGGGRRKGEERRIEMSLSKKVRQQELIGHCSTGVAPAAFARF